MPTESERLKERYNRIEREADAWGRIIGVRRLQMDEEIDVTGMFPQLVGSYEITVPPPNDQTNGQERPLPTTVRVPHVTPFLIAASVCEITTPEGERQHIPFPRNEGELRSIMRRLDREGTNAATAAYGRLIAAEQPNLDTVKNSLGTPSSEQSVGS